MIEQYQNAIPDVGDEEDLPARTAHSLAKPPSRMGKYLKTSSIYLLVLVALLLIYSLIVSKASDQPNDSSKGNLDSTRLETTEKSVEKQNKPTNPQQPMAQSTPNQLVNTGIKVTKISTTSYKNRAKDVYEVVSTQNQEIRVQLNFIDSCWFEIRKGGPRGKLVTMNTLGKGEMTDLIALDDQELWIHLGNASGVQLNVNDQKVTIGNEPGPKYISILKKK
ncbi:RodZ domain-containing protein [Tepidibacillus marianensis]|uniref:RodZ domain-containing protein n=1 Tax=Tepidibacillus marianensis TaxID=3131995 RepID=UPI0030CF3B59